MAKNTTSVHVDQDSLTAYISSIKTYPILSEVEESELTRKMYYLGDSNSAKLLLLSHLRFVVHIAQKYKGYNIPIVDLIQEGNLGLMKALEKFNPEIGVRFVSFAIHWIRAAIHEYVLCNWGVVKVATTKSQKKLFFNLRKNKTSLAWLTNKEINMIARKLNVSKEEVIEMEKRFAANDMAFDINSDEVNSCLFSFNFSSSDFSLDIESEDWDSHVYEKLKIAIDSLDKRAKNIIYSRWLNEDKRTLQDLANEYNVSSERIRQLENNAMKKLRAALDY